VPPQNPAQVACVPLHDGRVPRGAPVIVRHAPTWLASAQAWHWPAQASLQQTLSTQWPLPHSASPWHCVPVGFVARQTPVELQYCPVPQGMLALQPPEQVLASAHRLLAQGAVVVDVQAPAPLHTDAVVARPLAQLAAVHWTALPGKLQAVPLLPSQRPWQGAAPAQEALLPRGAPKTLTQVPGPEGWLHD
jgi:hypothetical protein